MSALGTVTKSRSSTPPFLVLEAKRALIYENNYLQCVANPYYKSSIYGVGTFINFVWVTIGEKFLSDHISAVKELKPTGMHDGRYNRKSSNLVCFRNSSKNYLYMLATLSYNHTCELKLYIFFLC